MDEPFKDQDLSRATPPDSAPAAGGDPNSPELFGPNANLSSDHDTNEVRESIAGEPSELSLNESSDSRLNESSDSSESLDLLTAGSRELAAQDFALVDEDSVLDVVPSVSAFADESTYDSQAWRRRDIRRNLFRLLTVTLASFVLTAWILVRLDASFGSFLNGPQDVVRAQLQALDQGQIRPAYELFSPRYRQQVSFDVWRELIATHWRMFHAQVLRAGEPEQAGAGVNVDIVLRGADQKAYRAQFRLVRNSGRWWIDDLHWSEAPDPRGVVQI